MQRGVQYNDCEKLLPRSVMRRGSAQCEHKATTTAMMMQPRAYAY